MGAAVLLVTFAGNALLYWRFVKPVSGRDAAGVARVAVHAQARTLHKRVLDLELALDEFDRYNITSGIVGRAHLTLPAYAG